MTKKHSIRLGARRIPLPGSVYVRILIGLVLILGGFLGFLPVLGFWMVPLGLMVLSVDLPFARRWRRRVEVWWGGRKAERAAKKAARRGRSGIHKEK